MKFTLSKYHKNTLSDLNVYGKSPLIHRIKFYGHLQLENGWVQEIISEIRQNVLQDITSYIQLFDQGTTYNFYNLESKDVSKTRANGEWLKDKILLFDAFVLDDIQMNYSR